MFFPVPVLNDIVVCLFGIDDLAAVAAVGLIVNAGISLYNNWRNEQATAKANEKAEELYKQGIEENKEVAQNGLSWKVADAKKAGLSPLAALGASTAGNVVGVSNPTMQAPKMDFSALMDSVTSMSNEFTRSRTAENVAQTNSQTQKDIANANIESMEKIASDRLNFEYDTADAELAEKIRQYDNTTSLELQKINASNKLQVQLLRTEVSENTAKRLEKVSDNEMEVIKDFCNETGIYIPMQDFKIDSESDYQEWLALDNDFRDGLTAGSKELNDMFKGMSAEERYDFIQKSKSVASGWNAGLNVNGKVGSQDTSLPKNPASAAGSLASKFLNGLGGSVGSSSSDSTSEGFQKDKLESYTRAAASDYYRNLKYYRPVFTKKFLDEYSGKITYSELSDAGLKSSSYTGYKRR